MQPAVTMLILLAEDANLNFYLHFHPTVELHSKNVFAPRIAIL